MMNLKDELTAALIEGYQRTGKEVGYWGRRFLLAVRRNGGLLTAKRMLAPRNANQRAGLDALLDAGRPDLTLEAIILQPKFRKLFTEEELSTDKERLGEYGDKISARRVEHDRLYPDEPEPGRRHVEGVRKLVRVNAFERDAGARRRCLKKYGYNCTVCGFNFAEKYGSIGEDFIHIHHLKPLALTEGEYEIDPLEDLRPVCPNCHAMLHRPKQELSIAQLQKRLKSTHRTRQNIGRSRA